VKPLAKFFDVLGLSGPISRTGAFCVSIRRGSSTRGRKRRKATTRRLRRPSPVGFAAGPRLRAPMKSPHPFGWAAPSSARIGWLVGQIPSPRRRRAMVLPKTRPFPRSLHWCGGTVGTDLRTGGIRKNSCGAGAIRRCVGKSLYRVRAQDLYSCARRSGEHQTPAMEVSTHLSASLANTQDSDLSRISCDCTREELKSRARGDLDEQPGRARHSR